MTVSDFEGTVNETVEVDDLRLSEVPVPQAEIDVEEFRLPQDFGRLLSVASPTVGIEIRKPDKMEYNRTHFSWEGFPAAVIRGKLGAFFVLHPSLYAKYSREAIPMLLVATIDLMGVVFLWPIRLPGISGKLDVWNLKARQGADLGKTRWIRIIANEALTGYDIEFAKDDLGEPAWPADITSMQQLLGLAFRDCMICDENHPVLQHLAGKGSK
jgi:hypothetical protein